VGSLLPIATPAGEVPLRVSGIIHDYSPEAGVVLADLRIVERLFGPGPIQNAALYLEPGRDVEATVDALKARLAGRPLLLRSNRTLREEVFAIFDQTFAVTRLLQATSLLIAACGIALTLLVLARERAAEIALYRSLGASGAQVVRVYLGQGLGIALYGIVLGALGGAAFAAVLILLINRAWFGWTIAVHVPWVDLGLQALTILAVAALASLYPAWVAGRTPATELSREAL